MQQSGGLTECGEAGGGKRFPSDCFRLLFPHPFPAEFRVVPTFCKISSASSSLLHNPSAFQRHDAAGPLCHGNAILPHPGTAPAKCAGMRSLVSVSTLRSVSPRHRTGTDRG